MTDDEILDLSSDYLISSFGQTTATGLSALLDGQLSHDRIRRFLAGSVRTSSDLWQRVKPHVRAVQREDGVLILDDSAAEKPYTDENDIVCWHYDHSKDRMVKGVNFLTAFYHCQDVSFPVGITLIAKTEHYTDKKDGKQKRRSPVEKNVYFREMVQHAVRNQIVFRYVLNDVWFASAENMRCSCTLGILQCLDAGGHELARARQAGLAVEERAMALLRAHPWYIARADLAARIERIVVAGRVDTQHPPTA